MDESPSVNAAFVASPGNVFSITGAEYGRDSAIIGTTIMEELTPRSRVFLTYDGKFNGGFVENAVSGGVRFEF